MLYPQRIKGLGSSVRDLPKLGFDTWQPESGYIPSQRGQLG
jgi:hypothetical protein